MTTNLLLLLMVAIFAMEGENTDSSWERCFEQMLEEQANDKKQFDSLFAQLREQEKYNQQKSKEIEDLKKCILKNASPLLCSNSQILNQNYDRQIEPKLIHQLEENAQFHDFLTDKTANVLNDVPRNEPVKTKELEMFGNMKEDLGIIEEPEKCTICFEIIEDDKEKFTSECKHLYHYGCIQKWLENHRNCPVCRKQIFWCQVWIPFDDFQKTKKRAPFPLENINRNQLNQVNVVQRIADHENQQIQPQRHAPNFELRRIVDHENQRIQHLNSQRLQRNRAHPRRFQENQIQNALLANQEQNALNQLQTFRGRQDTCLMYSLFSTLEVFIVICYVYIPKWHVYGFVVQLLNVAVLVSTILIHILRPARDRDFSFSFFIWSIAFVTSYHSIMGFLLSGNNLSLANFFPWFAVVFFPVILGCNVVDPEQEIRNPSRNEYILPGSIWILIEIIIVCAKLFVLNWVNWFGWMQGFHVASLIMFLIAVFIPSRDKKWWNLQGTWVFSAFVGLLTYFSLSAVGLSTVNASHCFLWPLILFFGSWPWWPCCIPNNPQNEWGWQPSLFVQSVSYSFWILSQIAIVLAKIYVTEWAVWYGFMQGLLAVTFVWYTIFVSKCTERIRCWGYYFFLQIAGLQTVTSILSYASVLHNLYRHPHLGYSVSSAFFLPLFIYLIVFSILAAIFGRCCR